MESAPNLRTLALDRTSLVKQDQSKSLFIAYLPTEGVAVHVILYKRGGNNVAYETPERDFIKAPRPDGGVRSVRRRSDLQHYPPTRGEAVYRANLEMRYLRQEVVRVMLLDAQNCGITSVEVCKGTVDESLAHPREIFRPVIVHAKWR